MDEQTELILIEIAPADLQLIDYALFPYAQMVHLTIERSLKRNMMLKTIEALRQRLVALKLPEEGVLKHPFPLTGDEVAVIEQALAAFVENIARLLPASQWRDEMKKACEVFRLYILTKLK
jgi:hypothetical protein